MKTLLLRTLGVIALAAGLTAQLYAQTEAEKRAADLEAKLRQTLESSDAGARIMLELIDTYYAEGQLFGLVRTARTFVNTQASHPKHEETMWRLMEGLMAASRNNEIKSTGLQFLERYPNSKRVAEVHLALGEVFDAENKRREAADHYRGAWEKLGRNGIPHAEKAFRLYYDMRNPETAKIMGEMALKIIDQLPANVSAAQFAYNAMYQTRHYGKNQPLCIQIGLKAMQKKLPFDSRQGWEFRNWMGDIYRGQGQHSNAIKIYREAIALDSSYVDSHKNLVRSLYDSKAPHNQIQQAVDQYIRNFPNDRVYYQMEMRNLLASDKQRNGDLNGALSIAQEVLKKHAYWSSTYFGWLPGAGEENKAMHERGVQIYQQARRANPEDAWRLDYYAAFSLYRDRLKNENQTRQILRGFLYADSPADNVSSEYRSALNWLLETAPNEAEFQKEIRQWVAHSKKNGHLPNYTNALEYWMGQVKNSKDEETRKRLKWAKDENNKVRQDNAVRLWASALQNRMRGHGAREQLLKTNLSKEQKAKLLYLHASDIRNYGDSRRRNESIPFYEQLAKLLPDEYEPARQWVEAAGNYGKADEARIALEHVMRFDLPAQDAAAYYHAINCASKTEDQPLMKKAYEWIRKNNARLGWSNGYANHIISRLVSRELEAEAGAYASEAIKHEPNHSDTASAVNMLGNRKAEGQERINFYKPYYDATPGDNHGHYANYLAYEYFRIGDYANWERICRETRKRQDERRLRSWSFSLHDWVSRAMQSTEITAEQKLTIYQTCADMDYGRESELARLAVLEVEGHALKPMERLLAYRNATMNSPKDSNTFRYQFPWAQKALARNENAEAATLATALLNNVGNSAGVDAMERARSLVREAYGKMGALGMEVSADNPMAPLLEIGVHLRLEDRERALEAYSSNLQLFDEYMLELPVELVSFAADSHIVAGGEENHNRAEEILRKWMIKHSESEKFTASEKATMQFLLGKNYHRGKRYEVARSEYTTVVNRYPDTEEATEAQFGIGETLMAQKIFDQAEEKFQELANSPMAKIRVRGMFLLGVLENRKGNSDEARDIFREVLSSMPDVALANETLYNLAEVYGGEQRFLEQLELLRTVGRLGQGSKRWHEPGRALSIVVQDSDLGISRGHTRIPVEVTTTPGGDKEVTYIVSGGAGKGLFIGEIETGLGQIQPGNGVLEVGGNDLVHVDYPEVFKKEFKFEPLPTGDIGMAADADFRMASSQIIDENEETESEQLAREQEINLDLRRSISRPRNEIKPGNPVYLRVDDPDRDLTQNADQVTVKLTSSSGDEVQAILNESGSHSGRFEGQVMTSDLPAGAQASDTAIDQSPLMAIDKDPSTTWVSQPDGLTPKWLSVDVKELRMLSKGTFTTPNPLDQAPVRARVLGSHDGRFWYPLAEHPQRETAKLVSGSFKKMTRRVWRTGVRTDWTVDRIQKMTSQAPDETEEVDELIYETELPVDPEARRQRRPDPVAVVWQGTFVQPRDGAVRFEMRGQFCAASIDGFLFQPPVPVQQQIHVDVFLEAGLHDLVFFTTSTDSAQRPVEVRRARENPNISEVRTMRFIPEDFDLTQAFVADLKTIGDYKMGTMGVDDNGHWKFEIEPRELRHVRFVVDEYLGQAVAINSVTVSGPEEQYIPAEADLLMLSSNNVLELTPGDQIESTYIDELPTGGNPRNRALTQSLNATYYNGSISPISYDFIRNPNGQVVEITKDLLRIDPGERITIEIVDYDMDATGQEDKIPLKVQVGDGEIVELVAYETEETSGIFKTEIDSYNPDMPEPAPAQTPASGETPNGEESEPKPDLPKLALKPGQQVFVTYRDQENTFPGHAIDREAVVYVREPTDAKMRIIETRSTPADPETNRQMEVTYLPGSDGAKIKGLSYDVPLTVEVIDPDAARDSLSTVKVQLTLNGNPDPAATPTEVECFVSTAFSDLNETLVGVRNPALQEGRFVGQVLMRLGGPDSPRLIPRTPDLPNNLVGRALPPSDVDPLTGQTTSGSLDLSMLSVLNLTGADTVSATYLDSDTPSQEATTHVDQGRLLGNAQLAATDSAYEEAVEGVQVGERLYLRLTDPDQDRSGERDKLTLQIASTHGEEESVELEETLSHSGVFTGSFRLKAQSKPTPGNYTPEAPNLEAFFGEQMLAKYVDSRPASQDEPIELETEIPVSDGTDGAVAAFTKVFGDESLAIQTQFHIAESYFELFKSHLNLERQDNAYEDLENGRRVLQELQEDYPDPKYAPRVAYLLGQFAQELKDWDQAITSYETIVRQYPDHTLAADAQYKLGQCYEEASRFDDALEAYVTLAATYPQNPLISSVMIRINEHFYRNEEYMVAAQVGQKFMERFESHEHAPRMAFRSGQCFYKAENFTTAGLMFDDFVKRFPEDELTAQALFWSGESYRQANNVSFAFRRYNRCRWDFPESDAAKYARGRLALPEMLAQFEREAATVEDEQ
tara:strand:- start:537 stop:7919 length:7383 start_codon:yes stop_codon:yes gene_type:complete